MESLKNSINKNENFIIDPKNKIKKICISSDGDSVSISCNLFEELENSLFINFTNTKNIKIKDIDEMLSKSAVVAVKSVKDDQLPGINWYIQDTEDEYLSFYCESIEMQ